MDIGRRIENLLEVKNMTQAELAQRTHISRSVINRIVAGTRAARDEEIVAISKVFDVSTNYLLGTDTSNSDIPTDLRSILNNKIAMTYGGKEISDQDLETITRVIGALLEKKK